jgi:hypothetical protein
VVKVLAQANVAVVHANDTKPGVHQRLHQLRRPGHQLHAQAHDQQDHRAGVGVAVLGVDFCGVFNFDVNTVCSDFHSYLRLFDVGWRPIWLKNLRRNT